ncbi:MAG TPA: TIM-barrel domain-containing protein [Fimbriimonadaceae bacterium]|nr:TIM-barrel domain-containing protein [Fimbriimonadaceae bacterium]
MLCLLSLAGAYFQVIDRGFVAHTAKGLVRLEACTDSVVRETVAPGQRFSDKQSLVITRPWPKRPKFAIVANSAGVTLRTARLSVRVDYATGGVAYSDRSGRLLLNRPAFPAFKKVTALGQIAFDAEMRFAMPPGEAYYGLGGHQNGVLDYRGESVKMVQENMEDVNPFLISSKGYGLLWDTASAMHLDFGGRSGPIPSAKLFDDEGHSGGLTGHYFQGRNFEKEIGSRQDARIGFDWGKEAPMGLGHDDYSVRWTGYVEPDVTGDYSFTTVGDDGVRLWVGDKLLVNDWRERPPAANTGRIRLVAHRRYPVRMEYYQAKGGAEVSLMWRSPVEKPAIDWSAEFVDQTDTYFVYGPSLDAVVAQYRAATGPTPLFGKWAYGLWQCKERYKTQQELLDIAGEYRRRKIPLDNIVQDWFYWDPHPWGSHQLDANRYPDMKAAIDKLHAENVHLMISVWGKFAPGSANYEELDRAGYLYPAMEDFAGPAMRYYDALNPQARAMYWRQIRDELLSKGIDAWWLDATEPEVDMNRYRETKTALGPGVGVINAYSLKDTEGVYKGQRTAKPNQRVFILTRSVFAGQQRNAAATWSGDVTGDWDTFARQIPCGLNFCMAGVPYWCTDIGGFFSRPNSDPDYRELFVRWYQYGAFCPIFRVHGTGTDKEPWRFGPEDEHILVDFDRLRYRLMPYIYSLAWQVTSRGDTIMRGLPMDFDADPKVLDIADQFMFGHAMMIDPVIHPHATSRSVYLPAGAKWFDFWTGVSHAGGRSLDMAAPLSRMPILIRSGSIVPMGPELQYASEKPADPIELRVYPGADGSFTLYEDDGLDYGYEKGRYATIAIRWNDRTRTISFGTRHGSFPGLLGKRRFRIVLVRPDRGIGIGASQVADKEIVYAGKALTARIR